MNYTAAAERYGTMAYHRCGNSGLKLPELSLDSGTISATRRFMRI